MTHVQKTADFVDVLSSIRRLVAETKKSESPPVTEAIVVDPETPELDEAPADARPASRLPTGSRFVLTSAHRVGPGDDDFEDDDADMADGEEAFHAQAGATEVASAEGVADLWADDARDDGAATLLLTEPVEAEEAEPGPAVVASLEETIAELEAAVAGIDQEFEPDLGDAGILDSALDVAEVWPAGRTAGLERASETAPELAVVSPATVSTPDRPEFRGIMAGIDSLGPVDDRLDLPIIGDLTMPLIPSGDRWRVSLPMRRAEGDGLDQQTGDRVGAAEAEQMDAAGSDDPSPGDASAHADRDEVAEPDLDLAMAVAAGPSGPVAAQEEDSLPADADNAAADDEVQAGGAVPSAVAPLVLTGAIIPQAERAPSGDVAPLYDEAAPEEAMAHVPEPAADGDLPETKPEAAVAGAAEAHARIAIIRPDAGLDMDAAADLAGDDGLDDLDTDGPDDLLDPLAGADIDRAMLRDLVTEILREEMRGALGERITRNIRVLVRREIERVLAAELGEDG